MFFPLRDENPTRRIPYVTYALIAANLAVFVVTQSGEARGQSWLAAGYGLVARRIVADPLGEAFTIFSSMFMHAGWWHLVSNMVFLHVFGDNLEDALGRGRYLLFYLLSGVAAGLLQVGVDMASPIPMVGASGAIAGVIGGYLLLYPRSPVVVLNTLPPLWLIVPIIAVVPAQWVALEFFVVNGVMALQKLSTLTVSGGGIAVFAHLGGFFAGLALVKPLKGAREVEGRRWTSFQRKVVEQPPVGRGTRWRRTRRPGSPLE